MGEEWKWSTFYSVICTNEEIEIIMIIFPEIKQKVVEYAQDSLSGREGKHDSKFEKGFRDKLEFCLFPILPISLNKLAHVA